MSGLRAIWISAVALLLSATAAAFAHDEGDLIRVHNHCRDMARLADLRKAPKARNAAFQTCLRREFSARTCQHPDRSSASRAHGSVRHNSRAHGLCRDAAATVCQTTRSRSRCQSRVMHDCLKTEDLCKQGARLYSAPVPAFPSVQ